jgi:hypothetical protein
VFVFVLVFVLVRSDERRRLRFMTAMENVGDQGAMAYSSESNGHKRRNGGDGGRWKRTLRLNGHVKVQPRLGRASRWLT